MSSIADGPGELAHAHLFGRQVEALEVAQHFRIPVGQLQSKGDGLGVHPVSAANHRRVFELPGTTLQDVAQLLEVIANDDRGLLDQERLRGVDHVIGGETIMQPARFRADFFGDGGSEGDDVVLHLGFNLADTVEVEVTLLADGGSC